MRVLNPSVPTGSSLTIILLLLVLTGCSAIGIESKRVDYKAGSIKAPPLDVPPDLTALAAGDRYVIPDSGGEIVASYSEYSKGEPVRQQVAKTAVLPGVPNVQYERSSTERWLVVGDNAENVWPKIKAFWLENGFTLQTDNPEAGLMETDWLENRAKIPQGGLRSVIGKVFDKIYSSGEKDSYRTRLERKKDGNGTEIHIRHRGMTEVFSADKSTSAWQPRPPDPEMEAAMLQLLMVRLGGNADRFAMQDGSAGPLGEATPKLEVLEGGSKNMLLSEPVDKCWRRIGLALEQPDITVKDKDRAKGVYFVSMSKKSGQKTDQEKSLLERLKFWRNDDASTPELYQVFVREVGEVCRVSATNKDEAKDEATTRLVELLYEKLSK